MNLGDNDKEMEDDVDEEDKDEEDKLNLIISNKAEYFDLLFDLLNLGISEITNAVWNLLCQIPVNKRLLGSIKSLQHIQRVEPLEFEGWSTIVDPSSTYKMLYSL